MHNPQVKAIRFIELFLLSSAFVLYIAGSIFQDTFFLRLATEALIFERNFAIVFFGNRDCDPFINFIGVDC